MRVAARTGLAATLFVVVLTSCEEGPDQSRLPSEYRVAERYDAGLDIDLGAMERGPTGIYIQDVVEGTGARADSGDVVTVHYTGWLPQGREFDSSRGGDPLEVALGYGRVIQGWDQGVVGMRVGGRRRLVIPPVLAYGESGMGPIPGNATLVFDIELLDVVNRVPEAGGPSGEAAGDESAGGDTAVGGSP